jgi:hypothetical protein
MGELLIMPLLTLRGYARSRKARGLSGGSPAAVKKAIDSERITRLPDGRIDQAAADADWHRNTAERGPNTERRKSTADGSHSTAKTGIDGRREAPARGDRAAEFRRGADWLSHQVCVTARGVWPPFVREQLADMPTSGQVKIIALICERLEGWTGAYGMTERLPEVDWGLFGADASFAAAEYEQLRQAWPAIGRVDLADPDATADFFGGAKLQASAIVKGARQTFPRLAAEVFAPDDRDCAIHLCALCLTLLEGWLANYVTLASLPPVDWSGVFSDGAADAYEQYRALRQEWDG